MRPAPPAVRHDARVARTCADPLRAAAAFAPDVVLVELRFPDGDGCVLATRLVNVQPRRPALPALFGYAVGRAEAERSPYDLHLLKPADPQQLVALLAAFAGARRGA